MDKADAAPDKLASTSNQSISYMQQLFGIYKTEMLPLEQAQRHAVAPGTGDDLFVNDTF
jgi:hypothetical protein